MTQRTRGSRLASGLLSFAPYSLVAALWLALYPGIFSDDSLGYWSYASTGTVYGDGPATWLSWIWLTSLGGRLPALATLAGGLTLVGSIDYWTRAFDWGRVRPWLVLFAAALPSVWAIGVTLWKDVPMTAGFFLAAGLVTRALRRRWPGSLQVALVVGVASLLISMRANGPMTALFGALIVLAVAFADTRRNVAVAALPVAILSLVFLYAPQLATDPSPGAKSGIEFAGLIADVGCAAERSDLKLTPEQQSLVSSQFGLAGEWWDAELCMWTDALYSDAEFADRMNEAGPMPAARFWLSVFVDHPVELVAARSYRLTNQLPWPITGIPRPLPFIQSEMTPNSIGIAWAFPHVAEALRLPIRAWNAARIVTGSPGLWLLVSIVVVGATWKRASRAAAPTVAYMLAMQILIFAFSPFSESRYGLLALIAGPALVAGFGLQLYRQHRDRKASEVIG